VPGFALHILFGEKADILLSSQRQIPMRLKDIGFKFLFPDIEAALRDLLRINTFFDCPILPMAYIIAKEFKNRISVWLYSIWIFGKSRRTHIDP